MRIDVREHALVIDINLDHPIDQAKQATRAFVRNLKALTSRPVIFWDERLSTAAVNRSLIDLDVSRAKRAAVIDKMAAAYILQGALDRVNRSNASKDHEPP